MSKAILILDWMPENCRMCRYGKDYDKQRSLVFCSLEDMYMNIDKDRTLYCPLGKLPEPKTMVDVFYSDCTKDCLDVTEAYCKGWNGCLDEIGGDEENEGDQIM